MELDDLRTQATRRFRWTEDDVMRYALAVGAGADGDVADLRFVTEPSLVALPTYANIITQQAHIDLLGDTDRRSFVHAGQSFTLTRPIATRGTVSVSASMSRRTEKPTGTLLWSEATAVDPESGEAVASSEMTVFVRRSERDDHAAESPSGPAPAARAPRPDQAFPSGVTPQRLTSRLALNQALLYRLTGDRNPLHFDVAFAREAGFDMPILHGMCTLGHVGLKLVHAFCGSDPSALRGMACRFVRPVYPGSTISVEAVREDRSVRFRSVSGDDVILDAGSVSLAPPRAG